MLATLASAAWAGPHFFFWPFLLIPLFWIVVLVVVFGIFGRRWRRNGYGTPYGPGYGHAAYGRPGQPGLPDDQGDPTRLAERTLAERFARGDIDEVEYRARLEVLRANRTA